MNTFWSESWRRFIDLFLPRSSELKNVESLSAEEFFKRARKNGEVLRETIAMFDYSDPLVKTAIHQIKYWNHQKIFRFLAQILYSRLIEELADLSLFADFKKPILIPIPMSAARRKERGYNQTENLAKEMARLDAGSSFELLTKVLTKIRETPAQSSLRRTFRLQNLKGCFEICDPTKICGRNIILLDDVTTTGATFKEARITLLRAGARKVIAIALAH